MHRARGQRARHRRPGRLAGLDDAALSSPWAGRTAAVVLLAVGLLSLVCAAVLDRLGFGGQLLLCLVGAWGLGAGSLALRTPGGPVTPPST
jgi:membrane-associated protease RseP (regulator of RpoE activity)